MRLPRFAVSACSTRFSNRGLASTCYTGSTHHIRGESYALRPSDPSREGGRMDGDSARGVSYEISYGKLRVPLYRVYASPLSGVPSIPESAFTGRPNILVGLEIDLEVFGESFLPAYTEGDNSRVVATDSMKNVILEQTLTYDGATMEGLLAHLGSYFLATYNDMERLRLTARELPFAPVRVPAHDQSGVTESAALFERQHGSYSTAILSMERGEQGSVVI